MAYIYVKDDAVDQVTIGGENVPDYMEKFETNPGYDLAGWSQLDGSETPNPDASIPSGITDWGSYCYTVPGATGVDWARIEKADIAEISEFSFGFDGYSANYSLSGAFCSVTVGWTPVTTRFCGFQFSSGQVDLRFESGSVSIQAVSTGKHRFMAYFNLATGAWYLKIDGVEVDSGTKVLISYAQLSTTMRIRTGMNYLYVDNVWFSAGEFEWESTPEYDVIIGGYADPTVIPARYSFSKTVRSLSIIGKAPKKDISKLEPSDYG